MDGAADRAFRIHLGCGSTVVPGWENVDRSPGILLARVPGLREALLRARVLSPEQAHAVFPPGIVRADVRKGIPFPDGSAEAVYSSHMIEHFARWEGLALLRECHRVLRPGGLLRIATPDLAFVVRSYDPDAEDAGDRFMESLLTFVEHPGSRAQRLVRRLFTAPHQWLYDERSLSRLFVEAGFPEPRRCGFREGALPDLERIEEREQSLFVEAVRP